MTRALQVRLALRTKARASAAPTHMQQCQHFAIATNFLLQHTHGHIDTLMLLCQTDDAMCVILANGYKPFWWSLGERGHSTCLAMSCFHVWRVRLPFKAHEHYILHKLSCSDMHFLNSILTQVRAGNYCPGGAFGAVHRDYNG